MLMAEKGSGSKIKLKEKMRNSMVPSFSEKTTYFSFKKGNKIQNSYRAKFIFRPKLSETDQNAGNTPKLTEILFELVIVASIKKWFRCYRKRGKKRFNNMAFKIRLRSSKKSIISSWNKLISQFELNSKIWKYIDCHITW